MECLDCMILYERLTDTERDIMVLKRQCALLATEMTALLKFITQLKPNDLDSNGVKTSSNPPLPR